MSLVSQSTVHNKGHHATIQLQGREVGVIIRAMKRKSLRLGVTDTGEIEVKIRLRCPQYEVMAFLSRHTSRLEQRLVQWENIKKARFECRQNLGRDDRFRRR